MVRLGQATRRIWSVVCQQAYHGHTTQQGGERFRLRLSFQRKRVEDCGSDLVNHAPQPISADNTRTGFALAA